MGFADVLTAEDRIEVKFSDFYKLVRAETERALLKNAVNAEIPREEILKMLTGKNDELEEYRKTELTPDEIREIDKLYAEKCDEVAVLTVERDALQKQLNDLQQKKPELNGTDDGK